LSASPLSSPNDEQLQNFIPHIAGGGGGKIYPQTDLFNSISEWLGIKTNALVTFPKFVLAMKWHYPGKSITIHNSKMAVSKPDIRKIW
jgi:hypothetical protein